MHCHLCGQEIDKTHKFILGWDGECYHTSCFHAENYGEIIDLDRGCLVKAGGILIPLSKEKEEDYDNVIPFRKEK